MNFKGFTIMNISALCGKIINTLHNIVQTHSNSEIPYRKRQLSAMFQKPQDVVATPLTTRKQPETLRRHACSALRYGWNKGVQCGTGLWIYITIILVVSLEILLVV